MVQRRTLLKTGLVGGTLLAIGATGLQFAGRDATADRTTVLRAIVPAILAGALPEDDAPRRQVIRRAIEGTTTAIGTLSPPVQDELAQLFTLMAAAPTRLALTGLAAGWDEASPEDVARFLSRWRTHRLALLQTAYLALHDLVTGPFYADEANWAAIGYGGPPRL